MSNTINTNISFICSSPSFVISASNRKEALSMIRNHEFDKYGNVVVELQNGERFNLNSPRGSQYFGVKV